ncbi:Periplasmic serine endoprotease DegP [archaeon HR04]|nr:Periplasmic serine endoprotease DegP [archaeon HR04]
MRASLIAIIVVVGVVASLLAYYNYNINLFNPSQVSSPQPGVQEGNHVNAQPGGVPNTAEQTGMQSSQEEQGREGRRLTLTELFKYAEQSVVQISVQKGSARGIGSGFIYDLQGHVVTNYHVVENASRVNVTFLDGTEYRARVVGVDPYTDIAVIKVDDVSRDKLRPLPLGDSSKLEVGEQVAAIGNPFGLSGSMTSGIVSQLGRMLETANGFNIPDVIQTDAAINPGNSGGPLLNMYGEVVGVNTAIASRTGEFAGIGFAIPSNTVKRIVPVLIEEGKYRHPWLGVSGRDVNAEIAEILGLKEARGFLVIDVVANSAAEKAGIKGGSRTVTLSDGSMIKVGGDVIIAIDGNPVRKINDILVYLQRAKSVGDQITLTVVRDGNVMDVRATLLERPNPLESP